MKLRKCSFEPVHATTGSAQLFMVARNMTGLNEETEVEECTYALCKRFAYNFAAHDRRPLAPPIV